MPFYRRRGAPLVATILSLLLLSVFLALADSIRVEAASEMQGLNYSSVASYVDLGYLAEHMQQFEGVYVTTNGTVRYYASFYMFEDFWLQARSETRIPVVVRFAGLPEPPEGLFIEVSGKIEYSRLEGGFYFLNATAWRSIQPVPQPSVSPTLPQPSPAPLPSESPAPLQPWSAPQPANPPTMQPPAPPAASPVQEQPNSALTTPAEYGLIVLAAIAAVTMFSLYLFFRRKKAAKPSR